MKILKGSLIVLMAVLVMVIGVETVKCQHEKEQVGCRVLDKNNSAIFITYEGLEEDKKREELPKCLLRLTNNTNCSIFIQTLEDVTQEAQEYSFTEKQLKEEPISYIKTKYGRVRREISIIDLKTSTVSYYPEFDNGVILPILHLIYDYNTDSIKPGNTKSLGGCIVYGYTLLPGQSLRFMVNTELFREADIVVAFEYEWEREHEFSYQSSHYSTFDRESLPNDVMKRFNFKSLFQED